MHFETSFFNQVKPLHHLVDFKIFVSKIDGFFKENPFALWKSAHDFECVENDATASAEC